MEVPFNGLDIHHHILPAEYVARLKDIGITTAVIAELAGLTSHVQT